MGLRKIFWTSFIVSSLVTFGAGILLHDWLAAALVAFVVMALFIHIAFNKNLPVIAGGCNGAWHCFAVYLLWPGPTLCLKI